MNVRCCLLVLGVLSACETPLELSPPGGYTPVLVVNSFFTPDSVWTVRVSRSAAIDEPASVRELFALDATVTVTGEGGYSETLRHAGDGTYRSQGGYRPLEGATYVLDASSSGLGSVRAVSHSPKLKTGFVSIVPESNELADDPRQRVRFKVTDLPGKSYFRLELHQVAPSCRDSSGYIGVHDDPEGVLDYTMLTFESSDPSFYDNAALLDEPPNALDEADIPFFTAYFSDRLFENATREFEIFFEPITFETEIESRFMLVVSGMSEEQVQYDRTLILQDNYLFAENVLFTRPIDVYSNVEGGLGIFAGYTNNAYRFDLAGDAWDESEVGIGDGPFPACDR